MDATESIIWMLNLKKDKETESWDSLKVPGDVTSAHPEKSSNSRRDHQGRSLEEEGMGLPPPKPLVEKPHPAPAKPCACVCVCVSQATDATSLCAGARGSRHIPVPREAFQGAKRHHPSQAAPAAVALGSRPQRRKQSCSAEQSQRANFHR